LSESTQAAVVSCRERGRSWRFDDVFLAHRGLRNNFEVEL
jgi:hypothetical protein